MTTTRQLPHSKETASEQELQHHRAPRQQEHRVLALAGEYPDQWQPLGAEHLAPGAAEDRRLCVLRQEAVTPEQTLLELQKALVGDERLSELLKEAAKHYADTTLRKLYSTAEPAMLIRQSGMAEGVEQFIRTITKHPTKTARPDRP